MSSPSNKPELNAEQHQQILQTAAQRVRTAVSGGQRQPSEPLPADIAKTPVYGAFVSLKRAGKLRSCCGCLGNAMPLAQAVNHAAERAALDDPRFPPITVDELDQLNIEVWLLWQPEPVRERGEARIGAVEIGRHGVQIARGSARGLLLPGVAVEHRLDAEAFLRQVCLKAELPVDAWKQDDTELMTFEGYAIHGKLAHLRRPSPAGESADVPSGIRPPAVAGSFYPGEPGAIEAMLDDLLPRGVEPADWAGAMIPHAGWIYSGRLAATTLAHVRIPRQVILFCPRHKGAGAVWAVAPYRAWGLPGRAVDADPELATRLAEGIDGLELDAEAHQREHAIEVQLPLLARLRSDVRVVGVALGGGELTQLQQFGKQLADVIGQLDERPLLIISSDMNHFANDQQTRAIDRMALDAMQTLDPALLYRTVRDREISMCGVTSAVVVMEALRALGLLNKVEEVGYATSADAGGGTESVVGYAGVLLG